MSTPSDRSYTPSIACSSVFLPVGAPLLALFFTLHCLLFTALWASCKGPTLVKTGNEVTVDIPLTTEQAALLAGMSRVDELSRIDEIAVDITLNDQLAAEGVRGGIRGGVRGGIRGAQSSGVRGAFPRRGELARPSPDESRSTSHVKRQDAGGSPPDLAFEITFTLPIKMANDGENTIHTRLRPADRKEISLLELTTTVQIKLDASAGLTTMEMAETEVGLNQVELPDLDGDGQATLVEVATLGFQAAVDSAKKADSATIQEKLGTFMQTFQQEMQKQGFEVQIQPVASGGGATTPPSGGQTGGSGTTGGTTTGDTSTATTGTLQPAGSLLDPTDTAISRQPTASTAESFTFALSCNKSSCTFRCSIDGAEFKPCSSPFALSLSKGDAPEGPHTLSVKAVDALGTADDSPASMSFTLKLADITAPDTALSAVSGQSSAVSGQLMNRNDITFTLMATEAGSTFQCYVDSGAFSSCASPLTLSPLTEGAHTFQARALDPAGNTDASPATFTWTVDTTAPDTTATCPASATNLATASVPFTSPDTTATFLCQLDTGVAGVCTTPFAATGLAEGAHNLEIKAKDAAGNVDATPAKCTWTVDVTVPDTTLVGAGLPALVTNQTTASFSFTSLETGASFDCELDGAGFSACTSPKSYTSLAAGSHTFKARAKDAAGSTDASPSSYSWTIDTTAPTVSITVQPANPTNSTGASFTFSSADTSATFECSIDSGAWGSCTSPKSYSSLTAGSRNFQVRATDPAGNVGDPASYTWTIDTSAPGAPDGAKLTVTQNTPGTADQLSGTAAAVEASSTVKVWSDALLTAQIGSTTAASDGSFTAFNIGDNLADGSDQIYVTATDAAGNQSNSTIKSNDVTAPTLSITTVEGDAAATYYDTANDSNTDIAISTTGATTCKWDTTDVAYGSMANTCTSTSLCTITGAATDGTTYTRYIDCIDSAGNTRGVSGNVAVTWTNDWSVPSIALTSVEGDTAATYYDAVNDTNTDVIISVTDASGATTCKWDTTDIAYGSMANTCTSTSLCTITAAATEGSTYTRYIACVDAAGNANDATTNIAVAWTNDWTLPAIAITNVEGDTAATYYDAVNDTNTDIAISVTDAVAGPTTCKWDTTDVAYGSMGNTCASTSLCTITGAATDGFSFTRYIACTDAAGNAHDATSNTAVAWTNDWSASPLTLTSVEGDTASTFYDNANDSNTDIVFSSTDATSGTTACRWYTTDSAYNGGTGTACASTTACQFTGAATEGSTYTYSIACVDAAGIGNGTTNNLDITWTNDYTAPPLTLSTVEGDAAATYYDTANDSNTDIVLTSTDAVSGTSACRWYTTDSAYNGGTGTACGSTTTCTITDALTANTAYTRYIACVDAAGNGSTTVNNLDVTWTNDWTAPTFGGASSATAVSTTQIDLAWTAASDVVTATANLVYDICRSTTSGSCNTFSATCTSGAGAVSFSDTGTNCGGSALTAGTRYYYIVRARDQAGNSDSNTSEKTAMTNSTAGVIKSLGSGYYYNTCAVAVDGTAKCWGSNNGGQLGDGTTTDRITPTAVSTLTGTVAIGAGIGHTCALLSDGSARCWGQDAYGELGDATTVDKTTPVAVTSLSSGVSITSNAYHTCALISDGTVKCWGSGADGQLGNGTSTVKQSTPVLVSTLTGAIAVAGASGGSAASGSNCALLSDGTIKCWGTGADGQLGDGTTVNKTTPVAVSTLTNAVAVTGGDRYHCALMVDGTVKCWGINGLNGGGQLGDGTTVSKSVVFFTESDKSDFRILSGLGREAVGSFAASRGFFPAG